MNQKVSAYEIVKQCRLSLPSSLKGDKLLPALRELVSTKGVAVLEKPFSTQIDRFCGKRAKRAPRTGISRRFSGQTRSAVSRVLTSTGRTRRSGLT